MCTIRRKSKVHFSFLCKTTHSYLDVLYSSSFPMFVIMPLLWIIFYRTHDQKFISSLCTEFLVFEVFAKLLNGFTQSRMLFNGMKFPNLFTNFEDYCAITVTSWKRVVWGSCQIRTSSLFNLSHYNTKLLMLTLRNVAVDMPLHVTYSGKKSLFRKILL